MPLAIQCQNNRYIVFFIVAPLVVGVIGIIKSDHEVRLHVIRIEVIGDDLGAQWKCLNEFIQSGNAFAEIRAEDKYARHIVAKGSRNIEDSIFNKVHHKARANNIPVAELVILLDEFLNDRNPFSIVDRENQPMELHRRHLI